MRNLYLSFFNFTGYLLFFSIPISVPLTRLSLKVYLVLALLLLFSSLIKLTLRKEDFITLSFPSYQVLNLLSKGELLSFLRAPNGLLPSLSYLIRVSNVKVYKALNLFILSSTILSVGIIVQSTLSVPDYRELFTFNFNLSIVRPSHTFVGHPLTAGAIVSTALVCSYLFFIKFKKSFYLIPFSLLLFGELFLFDRSYWIATAFAFVLVSLFISRSLRFLLLLIPVLSAIFLSVPQLRERLISTFDVERNSSNRYRLSMWEGAFEFYLDAPLTQKIFGVGRKGYLELVKPYVERAEREYSLPVHFFSHLHSNVITVLIWYGLIGLIVFSITFFYFIFINIKAFRGTSDYTYLFFLAFYVIILIGGFFEYNFEDEAVKYLIYLLFGLNVKYLNLKEVP